MEMAPARTPEEMVEAVRSLLSLSAQSDIVEPVRKLLQTKGALLAAMRLLKEYLT